MFRTAGIDDVAQLRQLAHEAEQHWGFDDGFMEKFDRDFNITADFVREHPVRVLADGEPVAFWGMLPCDGAWELEYFYVAERAIGKGYGRRLWQDLTGWCAANGVVSFGFVTSWQAVPFYEKMGASIVGECRSSIDGRPIPRLKFEL